jgi:hypothetical protein
MHRCADASRFFDRPAGVGSSLSRHDTSLRACPRNINGASFAGLVFSTTHRLILMVALKTRFTNSSRALTLVERTSARVHRTRDPCATTVPLSSRAVNTIPRLSRLIFIFFGICSSSIEGRCDEHVRSYISLGFFISSKERTSNATNVNRENAFDDTHLGVEHPSGERLEALAKVAAIARSSAGLRSGCPALVPPPPATFSTTTH